MSERYALFYGVRYYAGGGWCDFKGTFEKAADALGFFINRYKTEDMKDIEMWVQVIDLTTCKPEFSSRISSDGTWFDSKSDEIEGGHCTWID